MSSGGVEFTALHHGKPMGQLRLHLPGRHSVTNAMAAVAVGYELEIPFVRVSEALGAFTGIHRRFEIKGEPNEILVIDDYGHHPTEVRATIGAIRDSWKRPLTVIFQPHRFVHAVNWKWSEDIPAMEARIANFLRGVQDGRRRFKLGDQAVGLEIVCH